MGDDHKGEEHHKVGEDHNRNKEQSSIKPGRDKKKELVSQVSFSDWKTLHWLLP